MGHGRRRSKAPLALLIILAVAAVGTFSWWFLTRPAATTLVAVPSDAIITLAGGKAAGSSRPVSKSGTGTLVADELEPGTYAITVQRKGFQPYAARIELQRRKRLERTIRLVPMPFELSFVTRPADAAVTIRGADGKTVTAKSPGKVTVTAGLTTVTMVKEGYNPFSARFFLEEARAFDLILDPKGQLVHALGSIDAAGAPKGVALTPGNEAWSAILNGPPSIQIFDPASGRKTGSIDLGKAGAVEVIFNRAGTLAYVSQMETDLKSNSKVFEIGIAGRAVLRTLDTGSKMTKVVALSPDQKTLYTANWAGNDVSVIDLAAGKVAYKIPVAKTPRGLWPTADGKYLYVAGFGAGDLERIELATRKVTRLYKSGGAMRHLVADEKTGKLYASDMGKNVVWVCDMKTGAVTKFCDTDQKPNTIDLSPDGKVLFISCRGANNPKSYYIPGPEWGSILLYDTTTGKPLDAIVGGNQCTALDVSDDGKLLVFSDFLDNRLRVYEVPSYGVLVKGNGGRFAAHKAELLKKGQKASAAKASGSSPTD